MREDFTRLGDILSNSLPNSGKIKYALKASTLFGFWGKIVGRKFEKFSKPTSLKFKKLYVSCQNSYVAQELGLFKTDLLKKIAPYAEPLGLEVSDIVRSYKDWRESPKEEAQEPRAVEFTQEELEGVDFSDDELLGVRENIEKLKFLNDAQKEKYFKDIVNSQRAKKLRES
jgi:hypothetical protein